MACQARARCALSLALKHLLGCLLTNDRLHNRVQACIPSNECPKGTSRGVAHPQPAPLTDAAGVHLAEGDASARGAAARHRQVQLAAQVALVLRTAPGVGKA